MNERRFHRDGLRRAWLVVVSAIAAASCAHQTASDGRPSSAVSSSVDRSTVDALDASVSRDASGDAPPAVAGSFRGPQFEIDARWNVRSGEGGAVEPVLDVTITTVAPSRLAIPGAPWRLSLEPNLDGDAGAELIDARAVRVRGRAALDWTEERARFSVPLGALEGPLRLVVRVPQCQPNTCSMLNATVLLQAPPPSVLP